MCMTCFLEKIVLFTKTDYRFIFAMGFYNEFTPDQNQLRKPLISSTQVTISRCALKVYISFKLRQSGWNL